MDGKATFDSSSDLEKHKPRGITSASKETQLDSETQANCKTQANRQTPEDNEENNETHVREDEDDEDNDRIDEMMRDVQGDFSEMPLEFKSLFDNAEKPLFSGCSKFTKLSGVLKLYNLKAKNGWSDKSFTELLELVKDMLHLTGILPGQEFCKLKNLEELDLSDNSLEGFLPPCFCNMTSLRLVDLSSNQFRGDFSFIFPSLRSLEYIRLGDNHFHTKFSFSLLANHSKVKLVELLNNDKLEVDTEDSNWIPKFQLEILVLPDCNLNKFRGQIFSTSFNMTGLKVLSLEDNQFSGHISNAINRNALIFLDASNNLFSGKVNNWIGNMTHLHILFIRNNSLKGQLPCLIVSRLYLLDISHNSLSRPLPSCPSLLQHVLIQSNIFTRPIPETLLNSSTLVMLDIRDNNLSGNLPGKIGAENLRILLLGDNQLSGPFPSQLCWLQKLNLIDLSHNRLSGQIPRCINNVTFGKSRLVDNFKEFGDNILDLDKVVIYGNILVKAYEISTNDSRYDEVIINFVTKSRSNSYKGDILNLMSGLDLSCNNFTSEIPFELGDLTWIHTLNLSHNQIKGYIPVTFSRLRQLESLDLSYNNLTGKIPPELIDLNFLAFFSVAHNNLSGRIPEMK
nr:LRR receptor-like serine/threonine-protein kinase GSO1 [Ipomoea batatas]